ncbi:Uncharacterised protein [uncultured archaeon]|nr:Uncharacterised protein [uncultured archaeon]
MEKTVSIKEGGTEASTSGRIGRRLGKIAVSPFYRKIDGKTSHCAISLMVESNERTNGLAAGAGVYAREVRGVSAGGIISAVKDCYGVNAGTLAVSNNMRGFSFGALNEIRETNQGVAFGLLGVGVGAGIGAWKIGDYCSKGAVIGGLYAATHEDTWGVVASGFMTRVGGKMRGIMAGFVNLADSFSGFRIGVINMTLGEVPSKGVEIGLLNISTENPWWARVIPFVAVRLGRQGDETHED